MASNFPFRTRPVIHLVGYCRHCLTVLEYLPTIHSQVLELIIERCLEIDVEIKIHDGGNVSLECDNEEGIFDLDLGDENLPSPKIVNPENTTVDEMADKVSLMRMHIG